MTLMQRASGLLLIALAFFFAFSLVASTAQAKTPKVRCDLKEVMHVGGPDADEPAQFYEKIGTVEIDADGQGNVYVLDSGNCRVQVFGSNGDYVRTVGREGGGPGEFKLPRHLDVNKAGMLAVYDMGQNRISLFDAEGTLVRDQITGGMLEGIALAEDGSMILMFEPSRGIELEAYDSSGELSWKIGTPVEETDAMIMKFGQATIAPKVDVNSDGSVLRIPEGEYKVLRVKNGKEEGAWSRPFDRVDFEMPGKKDDDEEGEPQMVFIEVEESSGHDGSERNVTVGGGDHDEMTFNMDDLKKFMPEFTNDLRGIMVWPDGRVWVPTAETDGDRTVVDEWSATGEYTRKLSLPDRYEWLSVGADGNLYGVMHDEDDYPIVCRLDVQAKS